MQFALSDLLERARVVSIPLRERFRGVDYRESLLFEGPNGWAEFSPLLEYETPEASVWLQAAIESAFETLPAPVRQTVGVNAILPEVMPSEVAEILGRFGNFRTAKIKVAGVTREHDLERIQEVVRLRPDAKIRLDANGGWSVQEAFETARVLFDKGIGVEYFEQPCASIDQLVELRTRLADASLSVKIAADELVRKVTDPIAVVRAQAADILVMKVAPMGGIKRLLQIAEEARLPIVVSSALETSVGVSLGVRAAATLPHLDYDCGLATVALLKGDVVEHSLIPVDGKLQLTEVKPNENLLARYEASPERRKWWLNRLEACARHLGL